MDDNKHAFDIVFVSAFGRHNWLVRELARNEWSVGHLDVSRILGRWNENDLSNPFGMSKSPQLNMEQVAAWNEIGRSQKIKNGVNLLLDRGPFEGAGPMREFFKSNLGIKNEVAQYLSLKPLESDATENSKLSQKIKSLGFEDVWLINLSNQLASSVFLENARAHCLENGVPIFDELYKDFSTSQSRSSKIFFKNLKSVKNFEPLHFSSLQKGKDPLYKLKFEASVTDEVESRESRHKEIKTRVLVWGLTSAETDFLSHEIAKFLFPDKILDSTWSWQRFDYEGPSEVIERWPLQFYCINHLRLPWTHENLSLISKKGLNTFDVWMRIPCTFRFNSEYQARVAQQLQTELTDRYISKEFKVVDLPIETRVSKENLGPPRWPVYSFEDHKNLKTLNQQYLIFESCENLLTHQAQVQIKFQENLFTKLTLMRKQWLAVEVKLSQRAVNREISMRE